VRPNVRDELQAEMARLLLSICKGSDALACQLHPIVRRCTLFILAAFRQTVVPSINDAFLHLLPIAFTPGIRNSSHRQYCHGPCT
jgi:hypothetical protein